MADFHVGQEVVCIIDGPWIRMNDGTPSPGPWPQKGSVYKIRDIEVYPGLHEFVGLCLEEIPDRAYVSTVFRPVRKTDISCFEKFLLRKDVRTPELV